jgi:polysaccharide export outer membrane protein
MAVASAAFFAAAESQQGRARQARSREPLDHMSISRFVLGPVIAIAIAGSDHAQPAEISPPPAAAAPTPAGSVGAVLSSDRAKTYRLGSGDKVRILIYGAADYTSGASNEFAVNGDGVVSLPLIGDVPAAGRTESELQDEIVTRLKDGYYKDPKVSLEIISYRPFYILGEVTRPGAYAYTTGLTIYAAVATAGGFTYRANKHKVYIRRLGEPVERKVAVTPTTEVGAGDTIRVGERIF